MGLGTASPFPTEVSEFTHIKDAFSNICGHKQTGPACMGFKENNAEEQMQTDVFNKHPLQHSEQKELRDKKPEVICSRLISYCF